MGRRDLTDVYKFKDLPYEGPKDFLPDQELWRSVIDQAVIDTITGEEDCRSWFVGIRTLDEEEIECEPGFLGVCLLAGLDPKRTQSKVREILGEYRIAWRNYPIPKPIRRLEDKND